MFRHILRCPPSIVSAAVQRSAEKPRQESRRGLIGRPEGRPRPERVLKDAGAPPSFRTDPAAEAGLQPVRSRRHPSTTLLGIVLEEPAREIEQQAQRRGEPTPTISRPSSVRDILS